MKIYTLLKSVLTRGILNSKCKVLVVVLGLILVSSHSNAQVNIVIDPATTDVAVGETFNVNVNVDFIAGDIDAVAIFLDFDNTRLAVNSITAAPSSGILPIVALPLEPVGTIN